MPTLPHKINYHGVLEELGAIGVEDWGERTQSLLLLCEADLEGTDSRKIGH